MNCIQMISEQIPIFIHDQRNYLQQINACIEEFKDWLKADNIYIKTLENCLNQMNLQINSFLIYLQQYIQDKQTKQPLKIDIQETNLSEFLENHWQNNQFLIEKRAQVDYQILVCSQLPQTVKIPQQQVYSVLQNLLSNALKFTEQGCIKLIVSFQEQEDSQDMSFNLKSITKIHDSINILPNLPKQSTDVCNFTIRSTRVSEISNDMNENESSVFNKEFLQTPKLFKTHTFQEVEQINSTSQSEIKGLNSFGSLSDSIEDENEDNLFKYTKIFQRKNNRVRSYKEIQLNHKKQKIFKGFLKFEVLDTGIGIEEHQQKDIFKIFNKSNNNIENQLYIGSGIGLYSCKQIANMLQGDIVLYSKKNVGSAFVFYIPCIGSNKPINLENSKEECTEGVRIVQEKERKSPLRKDGVKNILFVDDNQFILQHNQAIFQNVKDVNIVAFQDPYLAIEYLKQHPEEIDLALIDYEMPQINGFDVCKQIKQINQKVIIICQSGNYGYEFNQQCIKNGFSDILQKPCTKSELVSIINKNLQRMSN